MDSWIQKLLASGSSLGQNGLKPETQNKLQQFADAQIQRTKQGVNLAKLPEQGAEPDNKGMKQLGAALAGLGQGGGLVTDNLTNQGEVGQLGQQALQNDENEDLLNNLDMFNSGNIFG